LNEVTSKGTALSVALQEDKYNIAEILINSNVDLKLNFNKKYLLWWLKVHWYDN